MTYWQSLVHLVAKKAKFKTRPKWLEITIFGLLKWPRIQNRLSIGVKICCGILKILILSLDVKKSHQRCSELSLENHLKTAKNTPF
jgi:hypothetical protein